MTKRSFSDALQRHPEIGGRPVSLRKLHERFPARPTGSSSALLRHMGPFEPRADGFRFSNGDFEITAEIAAKYLRFFQVEVIEQVARLGTKPFSDKLDDISIPVPLPFVPDITLPDAVIGDVVSAVTIRIVAELVDLVTSPAGGSYGRCGGMAFAGYDFYRQGWPVDGFGASVPAEDSALDEYVLDRLLDSLDLNAVTFLEWIMVLHVLPIVAEVAETVLLSSAGSVGGPLGSLIGGFLASRTDLFTFGGEGALLDRTKDEWVKIKERLDREAAWPVGLVYAGKKSPFNQHQVLAIGYSDSGLDTGTLEVWDNNHPRVTRTLTLDFRGDRLDETGADSRVRGIFLEEYEPRKPPSSLKRP